MKVINLFGGPGHGKSTLAAGIFHRLKLKGLNVELVTEYAKDMVFEGRNNILMDQVYILAKQNRRLERLREKVDVVVTDSPLILGLLYAPKDYYKFYEPLTLEIFNSYNNVNLYLTSTKGLEYKVEGRNQTKEEAGIIHQDVKKLLDRINLTYSTVDIDPSHNGDAIQRSIVEAFKDNK